MEDRGFSLAALSRLGLPGLLGLLAGALGVGAACYYSSLGLTLSHYDAKAHLVVSRRILDSLTPGWEQIGAVWLPLPHLVNMLPVHIDFFYRTGVFAIGVSILSHAVATAAIAGTVIALTSSRVSAALAAILYGLNANILYLQSTPMTEPMLFGLTTLQVLLFTRWVLGGRLYLPTSAAWVTVLACLTRYEAWPIMGACFVASAFAWWRRGTSLKLLVPVYARLALYPALTLIGFMVFSRITVGEWFVSGGFFVPDDTLRGQPAAVLEKIAEGIEMLGGVWLLRFSAFSLTVITVTAVWSAGRSPMLIPLSLFAAAALPLSAYLAGHPFRMRYEVPLIIAGAVVVGLATGLLRRLAPVAAVAVLLLVLNESRPFDLTAPMVREAQLDQNTQLRGQVTACLKERYQGGAIMASMGSLGHYMHEMSLAGFSIKDFLHEGNGPIWDSAFTRGPAPLVEWVLMEEVAEGGDAIAQRHRVLPRLLEDYRKICSGGNVSLYQRVRRQGSQTSTIVP